MRGGLVVGARIVCDARADARGLVAFARCAALYRMRCNALRCTGCEAMRCAARDAMREPMRCELVAMQCAALHGMRCASRCAANWLRCNALRAGWLHSRGAGGAMLFSYAIEGFLGWGFFGFG
jgi:hypothetical protein